ncbi:glycosyltransferase family 2 protein [Pelagibacterales bacterium SAG-MED17]|nr:glycosyltransferase family 2 protein [Pelagibacterales bacterium SAG-MED17]
MNIIILIPVFNDFKSVSKLIEEIDINISDLKASFSIIVVNDASTDEKTLKAKNLNNIKSLKLINMRNNRGHTRCIAAGLKYILENEDFDYVIPMDGDGEDRPEEIINFVEKTKINPNRTIVGERVKRSESLIFKVCYFLHKIITYTFTGKFIKFGNYTCLTKETVKKLIEEKATWSSFSGSLAKTEINLINSASIRGPRYFGPSKMSFLNLIKHSFAIIAVFKSAVIFRSIAFYAIYLIIIAEYISVITAIPLALIIIFGLVILKISGRENMTEFNNSLTNISDIDTLK